MSAFYDRLKAMDNKMGMKFHQLFLKMCRRSFVDNCQKTEKQKFVFFLRLLMTTDERTMANILRKYSTILTRLLNLKILHLTLKFSV